MLFEELLKLVSEDFELINEMPVGNISQLSKVLGDKELDSMSPRAHIKKLADVKLMRSDEFADRLKNKINLFKNTPYTFNIIFNDKSRFRFNSDILDKIKPHKDQITVIMSNHPHDVNSVLTPWIIAHRIGHALFDTIIERHAYKKGKNNYILNYGNASLDYIYELLEEYFLKIDPNYKDKREVSQIGVENFPDIFEKISNFKSAKQRKVGGMGEYINELVAEYLIKGRIVFNDVPDKKTSSYYEQMIQGQITKVLDRLKGTIIHSE